MVYGSGSWCLFKVHDHERLTLLLMEMRYTGQGGMRGLSYNMMDCTQRKVVLSAFWLYRMVTE